MHAYMNPTLHGLSAPGECSLTIFAHVPKVGGTSVDDVFNSFSVAKGRWTNGSWVSTTVISHHNSADALFAILRPVYGHLVRRKWAQLPDWRHTNIYHAFHPYPDTFRAAFLPGLAQLGALYRASPCRLSVSTVVREPVALLVSSYFYFRLAGGLGVRPTLDPGQASRVRANRTLLAADFERYAAEHANPQAAWHGARESTTRPTELLAPYDTIGVTERLNEFLWTSAARVGMYLPALDDGDHLSARVPVCNQNGRIRRSEVDFLTYAHGPRAASERATTVDKMMYDLAQRSHARLVEDNRVAELWARQLRDPPNPHWRATWNMSCHKGGLHTEDLRELVARHRRNACAPTQLICPAS